MSQNQNQKLTDLILFSLVLDEKQKQALLAKLPEFDANQLSALTSVFEAEATERDELLAQRFQNDLRAANNYTDTLALLRRQAFERAENLEVVNPEATLTALDQL